MTPSPHARPLRPRQRARARGLAALAALALLLAAACARQGYPSGGPKDETPPRPLATTPRNESRHFGEKQFYIQFDEYVVLKNPSENVLVSPPLKQAPEYTTKGKGVLVKLGDSLESNTTYLFQFRDAVADFTEGNLLPSFEYVFSTGASIDTMMLSGRVENARTGKPWAGTVTVMAYRREQCTADTVAASEAPAYVTRCDKQGAFAFHYIAPGDYRLVALEDANRNLRLDPDEAAAWDPAFLPALDSVDTASLPTLRLSAPVTTRQRVTASEFVDSSLVRIVTAAPMHSPSISGADGLLRLNPRRDTLTFWLREAGRDSATLVLADEGLSDTLRLRYRPKASQTASRGGRRGRSGSATPAATPGSSLMKALCSGSDAFYDDLRLAFANPIVQVADSAWAEVMLLKDSSLSRYPIRLDSTGLGARIEASLASSERYSLFIADSLFTDLYGHTNDSLRIQLTPKDYATLTLHIANQSGAPLVVEVLDSRDTVAQRQTLQASGTLRFIHLKEGDYRVRAVLDTDGDGAWTPGDYRAGRQPERAVLFDKTLQLRQKWEFEEHWNIDKTDP